MIYLEVIEQTMEDKLNKLKEYLQMDTEISVAEFKDYYSSVIEYLNKNYDQMDQDNRLKARYICSIIQTNAESRSYKDKKNAKIFRKISAKCSFWIDAIDYRLIKEGLTQPDIEQAMNEINKKME